MTAIIGHGGGPQHRRLEAGHGREQRPAPPWWPSTAHVARAAAAAGAAAAITNATFSPDTTSRWLRPEPRKSAASTGDLAALVAEHETAVQAPGGRRAAARPPASSTPGACRWPAGRADRRRRPTRGDGGGDRAHHMAPSLDVVARRPRRDPTRDRTRLARRPLVEDGAGPAAGPQPRSGGRRLGPRPPRRRRPLGIAHQRGRRPRRGRPGTGGLPARPGPRGRRPAQPDGDDDQRPAVAHGHRRDRRASRPRPTSGTARGPPGGEGGRGGHGHRPGARTARGDADRRASHVRRGRGGGSGPAWPGRSRSPRPGRRSGWKGPCCGGRRRWRRRWPDPRRGASRAGRRWPC